MAATKKDYKTFAIKGVRKRFYPSTCSSSNENAKRLAAGIRKDGTLARVVKSGKKFCVYTNKPGSKVWA